MPVTIRKELFGKSKDGRDVHKYTFEGSKVTVSILDIGCAIQSIIAPDRNGTLQDICLGYDNVAGYEYNAPYIGAIVGRVTGRISGGTFEMDGKKYNLVINNGPNNIHGGITGFSRRIWDANIDGNRLCLSYVSPDGEEGFPGEVTMTTTYSLTEDGALTINYTGTTTKPCPINITNHSYFNLSGHDGPEVFDHIAQIKADRYVPVNENLVPTGELPSTSGSPVDLNTPRKLADVEEYVRKGALDITYDVGAAGEMKNIARIYHPSSGRFIETSTTEPGLQFYTACFMREAVGKGQTTYKPFCSFCLEAQHFPDSVNHAHFPCTILRPGRTYTQTTVYKFGAE